MWREKEKEKVSGKVKNEGKEKDPESLKKRTLSPSSKMEAKATRGTASESEKTEKFSGNEESQESTDKGRSPEKSNAGEGSGEKEEKRVSEEVDGQSGGSKKKKRKGQKGNIRGNRDSGATSNSTPACRRSQAQDQGAGQGGSGTNLNHTLRNSYPYGPPPYYYPPMVYGSSYSTMHPSKTPGPFCYAPSTPYTCANSHQEMYGVHQAISLGSFEIFSDENANGCFIM